MNEAKLTAAIQGVVGTRTYLPIDSNESIIVFERKGYIHIFHGIHSVFGSSNAQSIARKLISIMDKPFNDVKREYHPELLELISGF